ncbi:hypothetical protein [uncultured Spirosoma sp.]|uniref:hypothetical protein n=1 Tax=uncultured Spirosoma sp. TaxID=278208 RepID=UPI00258FF31F|nr:hypothetical protein [uncultured Spirosoma sp.]
MALLLTSRLGWTYNYNEHKAIGNAAMSEVVNRMMGKGYFVDSLTAAQFLATQLHLRYDAQHQEWLFEELSVSPNTISYGDLNGLSGDHESNPLEMSEQLSYNNSVLNRIVQLQIQYGQQFLSGAPDKQLLNTDFQYGLLALTNFNHFYAYGKSLTWHLQTVDRQDIVDLLNPENTERVFNALKKQNSIRMYVTLHAVAIQLAQQAGQFAHQQQADKARLYLFYAVLYNAFADHFVEDMCAAGHMVVKRSLAGGITNNKALHDFYNRIGLQVVNLQGTTWKTNGDGFLNIPENKWQTARSFALLTKVPVTVKYQRAIEVVSQSLFEVMDAYFDATRTGSATFLQTIPDSPKRHQADQRETFYITHFGALSLVPLPLDSDIARYFPTDVRKKELIQLNRIPYYRNYARSRVANSLIVGFGQVRDINNTDDFLPYGVFDTRIIIGSKHYNYHDRARKSGTFDTWRGLTAAFAYGQPLYTLIPETTERPQPFYQIKGGVNLTGDLWLTRNTYVGLHSYLESGLFLQNGKPHWLVSPSVGIQFLPFVGTWAGTLPKIASKIVQLIVSQKWIASYQLISGRPSQLVIQSEFDISL